MDFYQNKVSVYNEILEKHKTKFNTITIIRVVLALVVIIAGYYFTDTFNYLFLAICLLGIIGFIILIKVHDKIRFKRDFNENLKKINQEEISFLKNKSIPFDGGSEFKIHGHAYENDLDVFGSNSLFETLNRTSTFIGKQTLAISLLDKISNEDILLKQESIQELAQKIDWRQEISALGKMYENNESFYRFILNWSKEKINPLPIWLRIVSFLMPSLFILSLVLGLSWYFPFAIFLLNLGIFGTQFYRIQTEIATSTKITKIIHQYSLILKHIEEESFKSKQLKTLQAKLITFERSSNALKKVANLFTQLDSINNALAAMLFNGSFFYHIHVLNKFHQWKIKNAAAIENWLDVIGEFEALNSLANFAYNNEDFCYPTLNQDKIIDLEALGHPLIDKKVRICNDIDFSKHPFVVLTGSNMSGKSTFLRSLGINLVLAGIGAPICAKKANIHPLNIIVSMRLTDSLDENESYFYAEVKRLKFIIETLENKDCFVLLDEILRGTNSEDKQDGTIAVIKKLANKNTLGMIATHDLEVCNIVEDFPNHISNKCFEANIVEDDLHFDYKLKDGICKNKSATFLMKKLQVI